MGFIDYYAVLGLDSNASMSEIKLAYRVLALKNHPDSSDDPEAEDKFQRISEAYDTLSNPVKRDEYDRIYFDSDRRHAESEEDVRADNNYRDSTENPWPEEENPWPDSNASESSADDEPLAEKGSKRLKTHTSIYEKRPSSIFDKLRSGITEKISTGAQREVSMEHITNITQKRRQKSIIDQLREERYYTFTIDTLESITGTTRQVAIGDLLKPIKATVSLPPGIAPGTELKVEARDDSSNVMYVKVKVDIKPHKYVEREGNDIILKIGITIQEAILGTELKVPTVDGPLKVRIPPGWQNNRKLRVRGRGLKDRSDGSQGDLFVKCQVVLPDNITSTVKESARAMDAYYSRPVRRDFPDTLRELKDW